MIVEWLVSVCVGLVTWLAQSFSDWEVPSWFVRTSGVVQDVADLAAGFSPFVEWQLLNSVILAVLATWGIFFWIKVARQGFAHAPGVGGAG